MTWSLNDAEFKAVTRLVAPKRYKYFLNRVADWREAWVLSKEEDLVLAGDSSGNRLLPVWPHRTFAAACANGAWADSEPEPIPITELLNEIIPDLRSEGHLLAVFPTPEDKGIPRSPDELFADLKGALAEIE